MKRLFITGLVILLPLALTIAIMIFVINLLTDPFAGFVQGLFDRYGLFKEGFLFLSASQVKHVVSQVLILASLFFSTIIIGVVGRWFLIKYFIQLWDAILHKIPFVRSIYKTCKDVTHTIFTDDTQSFKQVVLVPFPNEITQAIGLVTQENLNGISPKIDGPQIAVFVPTTPNPTSGFLMLYDPKDVVYLDMQVEEAFKYIISCGVITTPFRRLNQIEGGKA